MSTARIIYWLGKSVFFYAIMLLACAFAGIWLGEITLARNFGVLALLAGVISLIMVFTTHNAPTRERTRDALVFLFLFWIIVPFSLALPFVVSGAVPSGIASYFEAVSAITTTGASSINPDDTPRTLLLWRSMVQWSGGVFVATFAIVILAALNLKGTGVHRTSLFTLRDGELFSRLQDIGLIVAKIYLLVALVCFLFLQLSGTPMFDALCLSLSAVSTGGLTPRSGPLVGYVSNLGAIVLAVTCLLGAFNISVLYEMGNRRRNSLIKLFSNIEHRGLFVIISALFLIGLLFVGYEHIHTVAVEAVFMATTTGFDYHVIGIDIVPPSILIAFALVGGSALSTAGGIKIIRMLMLFRHLRTDLDRMTHPSRVVPVMFQGNRVKDKAFLSIWMYFFGYTITLGLGMTLLGAAGLDFETAIAGCASALSNMGPLLDITQPEMSYAQMDNLQLLILSGLMILGRLEILVAFAAISPSLWQK